MESIAVKQVGFVFDDTACRENPLKEQQSKHSPSDFPAVIKQRCDSDGDKTEATMTTCTVTTASSVSVRSDDNSTIASCCNKNCSSSYEDLAEKKRDQFRMINNAIIMRRRLQEQQKQQQQQQDYQKQHLSSPTAQRKRNSLRASFSKKQQETVTKIRTPLAKHDQAPRQPFHRTTSESPTEQRRRSSSSSLPITKKQDESLTCSNSAYVKTSSSSLSKKRSERRVRFVPDNEKGQPVTSKYPGTLELTTEEKTCVWWQPVDFKLFRRYCKRAAEMARQSQYVDDFTQAYDACSGKHIHDMMEFCHISRSHVRGLEAVVFPALVQARKLVVRGVVKAQDKLPDNMGYDQRAKILSATSRCLSGRARLLARVYGVGDEEVAKDCYYSMARDEREADSKQEER